jgi:hypothetical protein
VLQERADIAVAHRFLLLWQKDYRDTVIDIIA